MSGSEVKLVPIVPRNRNASGGIILPGSTKVARLTIATP